MTVKKMHEKRKSDAAGLRRLREYERLRAQWVASHPAANHFEWRVAMNEIAKRVLG